MNNLKNVRPPTWEELQRNPKLLIIFEPTEAEMERWPFLKGLAGCLSKYRSRELVHFCTCYNVAKLCRGEGDMLKKQFEDAMENLQINEENWSPHRVWQEKENIAGLQKAFSAYYTQAASCIGALENIKKGRCIDREGYTIQMAELCPGGRLFSMTEEEKKQFFGDE